MTVCRYYLQGNCRFGDRCRNEHTDPNYDDYEDSYSNYNRRYEHSYQDRYRQQESYPNRQNRHQDHDLSFGPHRSSNFENQKYQNRGQYESDSRYNQYYQSESYNQRNYSNQRYGSDNAGNTYNRKQYEWVSDDYKRRQQQADNYKEESFSNRSYSKPSSLSSFSFKDTDADLNSDPEEDKNLVLAEKIKEDIIAWELGNQWPFTCYHPFLDKAGFPGFNDVSFEELRYEALKAKENNTFNTYLEEVQKAVLDVNSRRNQLKQPTHSLLSIIKRLKAGEHLRDESQTANGFSFMNLNQTIPAASCMEDSSIQKAAASFSFKSKFDNNDTSVKSPASSFSFKSTFSSSDASAKNQASSFSFKLPESDRTGSSVSVASSSDSSIYTPMDKLSVQDKEQFLASTFTLGKIPTVPPPKILCF